MCGISGIYTKQITAQHENLINQILHDQHKRGPDYQNKLLIQGNHCQALLGHNRLSIIDLSTHANQPMWDYTNRFCITFNGEIYNYLEIRKELEKSGLQFQTQSDTEVILNAFALWGINSLNKFKGPFAFALFDKQNDELWLCRDRFGVRPLYYWQNNHILYFASSTTVLAKNLGLKPNLSYIAKGLNYLVFEDGSNETAYQNLFSLPAGCYIHAKINTNENLITSTTVYYNLIERVHSLKSQITTHTNDYLLQFISSLLEEAVQIRLRTDVPLAISLSGGLDSSSIAALVSKQHPNVIGFSYGDCNNNKTEGPLVAKCAKYLGIDINYVSPSLNEISDALFNTISAQDAPFANISVVAQFLLYKRINECNIKVILGGQGGDEAFMGYKKFMLFWLKNLLKQKNYQQAFTTFLYMLPMLTAEASSFKTYWQHRHRYSNQTKSSSVLNIPTTSLNLNCHQDLQIRQIQDITQLSLPTLLRYEDRNAMGNSVESRLPFLHHELVELGCALPEAIKLRNGYGKWPIRKIMQKQIPNKIRLAFYKRGFDIPLKPLLKSGLGKRIRSALEENKTIINEFLNPSMTISQAFSDQQFIYRRSTMAEAIALLWLSKVCI